MLQQRSSDRARFGWIGGIVILITGALLVPMGEGRLSARAEPLAEIEVPALPEGVAELFELEKEAVLEKFGEPHHIFYGDNRYTLENLPEMFYMSYGYISFRIHEDEVAEITLLDGRYVFGNGLSVGDSEGAVKALLGDDYTLREFENKDFLAYEDLGLMIEVYKPERIAREINIHRDYGHPSRWREGAEAPEFQRLLPQRIETFNIDKANLAEVKRVFGEPLKYIWGPHKILPPDDLPTRFCAVYPGDFHVFVSNDRVREIRLEGGDADYDYKGIRLGTSLDDAVEILGPPDEVVIGKQNRFRERVLYRDISGNKGHCYYHRPDHRVRLWFGKYKVAAIYLTRSDYSDGSSSQPWNDAFGSALTGRVAQLDIDNANRATVEALFGKPQKYLWGDKTFTADELQGNYILEYPCSFRVWMKDDRIMEIRHSRGSKYVYAPGVAIGASVEDVLAVLGEPVETVVGQKNEFKDRVLYRDIEGREGHCYYHRTDKQIRIFFWDDRVIAIYMTRSDFPAS